VNNACTVAGYRTATHNLGTFISGPETVCPLQTACVSASQSGAPGPYTYQWAFTTDGITYTNIGGNTPSACVFTSGITAPAMITIRLTITAGGQTSTNFHDVMLENDPTCMQKTSSITDPSQPASLNVSPNPAQSYMEASLYLPQDEEAQVAIYDLNGMLLREVVRGQMEAGSHTIPVDLRNLPAGVYLLQAKTPTLNISKRLVVLN
ncbi:MAG: T9SS type A sorting domain-containing protein, partial [Bacteroidota bacterium]